MYPRFIAAVFIVTIMFQWGCSKNHTEYDDKTITKFNNSVVNPQLSKTDTDDSLRVYVDYSNGMHQGINATMGFVKEILTIVNTPKTKYFEVGKEAIPPEVVITEAKHIPWNISNYNEVRSVLDKPIEMIVGDSKRTSVFITDFELVKSPNTLMEIVQNSRKFKTQIDISSWAVNYFYDWLKQGNSIDVFASKFTRQNYWIKIEQVQYVYVIVFTPRSQLLDQNSVVNRLLAKGYGEEENDSFYHFDFSTWDFKLDQKYSSVERGGQHDFLNAYETFNHKESGFEYYNFDPKEISSIILESKEDDKRILHNLFLTKYSSAFSDLELSLNVYDIGKQYDNYYAAKMTDQQPPKENPETGEKESSALATTQTSFSLGEPIPEMFELVFNKSKGEIGIKGHKNYAKPEKGALLLLNVVINEAKMNDDPKLLRVLSWRDARGFEVTSLYASLREAMERLKPRGRILYSYYLKF